MIFYYDLFIYYIKKNNMKSCVQMSFPKKLDSSDIVLTIKRSSSNTFNGDSLLSSF